MTFDSFQGVHLFVGHVRDTSYGIVKIQKIRKGVVWLRQREPHGMTPSKTKEFEKSPRFFQTFMVGDPSAPTNLSTLDWLKISFQTHSNQHPNLEIAQLINLTYFGSKNKAHIFGKVFLGYL